MSDNSENISSIQVLPYGNWPSHISAQDVAAQSRRLGEPQRVDVNLFWLDSRPEEKGRVQIVMQDSAGECRDLLPNGFSARSKVYEYGGGSYLATQEYVYFVNNGDQQIYQLSLASDQPVPSLLTPGDQRRFADLHLDITRQRLLAVCEDAEETGDCYLIAVPLNGTAKLDVITEGADFYSNPRLSPDGTRLSWLTWNHPNMPWDATRLWLAELDQNGKPQAARCVAGEQDNESLFQPQWSPQGDLYFVSDRSNWWNIYRLSATALEQAPSEPEAITQLSAEFATPQWTFGMSTYSFIDNEKLLATYSQDGRWVLATIDVINKQVSKIPSELTQFSALHGHGNDVVFVAASPLQQSDIYRYRGGEVVQVTGPGATTPPLLAPEDISRPQAISFATTDDSRAHGFFYPPCHQGIRGPNDARPPVIVICHGGPTGATDTSLNLKIQYWTHRGFAVLDVNYRGSTGYGRDYRQALYSQWGVRDVDDVCAAVSHVTEQGWVHPQQRIIKGSSAGGYTVLAALTFRDTFDAGVSLYGIGDLALLAQDTHKFESRYLDQLVGPWPAAKSRYEKLSPIHHVNQLRCPLLVFQGLQDKVVPPNQAQAMVDAVASRKIPVAYVTYADEGHGFRQGNNIRHMMAAEQYFYQRIFKLNDPEARATEEQIINIKNLDDIE